MMAAKTILLRVKAALPLRTAVVIFTEGLGDRPSGFLAPATEGYNGVFF